MPAAAVASPTPSMAGICGTLVGARGETAVAIEMDRVGWTRAGDGPSRAIADARAGCGTSGCPGETCYLPVGAGAPGAIMDGGMPGGRSRRSILAVWRSLATYSDCARR